MYILRDRFNADLVEKENKADCIKWLEWKLQAWNIKIHSYKQLKELGFYIVRK